MARRKIKEGVLAGLEMPLEAGFFMEKQALHLFFKIRNQKEVMHSLIRKR
jgi:hypothetical protein